MYVQVLPEVKRLQVECAGSICPPSLNPEGLDFPPGLLWVPGQLLKATVSGSAYLNGRTWAPPNHVVDMQITAPPVEEVRLAGRSDPAPDNLTSVSVPKLEIAESEDCKGLEAALVPVLREVLAMHQVPGKVHADNSKGARWWTCPEQPFLCPLSGFPICLLPYPPFKLRVDARHSGSHRLVDGRFLAMRMIVIGCREVCGRDLQASDISAIDDYMHRCKLGRCRPGRAAALEKEVQESTDMAQRAEARQELHSMVTIAKAELDKLRRIQENRLLQINRMLPARAQAALKNMRKSLLSKIDDSSFAVSKRSTACKRGRLSSSASVSTQAVTSSAASEASHE